MHTCEETLTSNTAKLAANALTNSEIRIRGRQHERMSSEGFTVPGRNSLILFPSPFAKTLCNDFIANLAGPVTLIVPDAGWRQTKKFVRHEPSLKGILHVKLEPGKPSQYQLRRQSSAENLCTLEAIARALGALESIEVQMQLETLLRIQVERTLWSRGAIKANQCIEAGIPPAAIT